MSAYKFEGMDEWYEKHKKELFDGKGFVKAKKSRYVDMRETKKSTAWAKKQLHYGDEYDKTKQVIKEMHIGGHTQKIFSDNNVTCNCNGWIFKRGSIRECRHVREIVGESKGISIMPKKITHKLTLNEKIMDIGQEINRLMKGMK